MRINLPPSYSTVQEYVQDTIEKLRQEDGNFTKLQIDDFHYPDVNFDAPNESFDAATICLLLHAAKESKQLRELELRFVEMDPTVIQAFIRLLTESKSSFQLESQADTKTNTNTDNNADSISNSASPRIWDSISIIGCTPITPPPPPPPSPASSATMASISSPQQVYGLPQDNASSANTNTNSRNNQASAVLPNCQQHQRAQQRLHHDDDDESPSTRHLCQDMLLDLALALRHTKCLVLNHNQVPTFGFAALGQMLVLPSCQIQQLFIKRQVLNHNDFFQGLAQNTSIQTLAFNFCRFDAIGIQGLCNSLSPPNFTSNTIKALSLQTLDLGACYLLDETVAQILDALVTESTFPSSSYTLRTLVLTLNSCHVQGSRALKRFLLSPNCRLQTLNLSHLKITNNLQETSSSNNSNYRNNNNNTSRHHHHQSESQMVQVCELAQALQSNTSLQSLKLSRNRLTTNHVKCLFDVLASKNTTLKILDLNNNHLTNDIFTISDKLPQGLTKLYLLNNDISDISTMADRLQHEPTSLEWVDVKKQLPHFHQIQYYCGLNKAGRHSIISRLHGNGITSSLWPLILERITKKIAWSAHYDKSAITSHDALYHLICQCPSIVLC